MITITIDCGASFIKGAVFLDGVMIKQDFAAAPAVHNSDDIFVIQQIDKIIDCVKSMLKTLIGAEKSVKLVLSNEMHGFILADKNGKAYTDYISWQKELGSLIINNVSSVELLAEMVSDDDIKYTGMPLRAGLPSTNLFYLKRMGKIKKGVYFYTLGDYILRVLSGKEPICHRTNAAATGLYDLRKNDWNEEYIKQIVGNDVIFPRVGDEAVCFNIDDCKVIALPTIGDQQAALLGAGFFDENSISFNLGTGAQISVLVKEPICEVGYQIRPYFYNYYLKTIPHIPSGRALNVYFRFVKSVLALWGISESDEACWQRLGKAIKVAEETGIKCDLSFFENAVTDNTKGAITQIGETELSVGNLFKAVLLSMSENFLIVADRLVFSPEDIKTIVFSGGVANRFDEIRNRISMHYSNAEMVIANNETMIGLYKYSLLCERGCGNGMS